VWFYSVCRVEAYIEDGLANIFEAGIEMSGKGAEKRSNALAVQVANLKAQGLTAREIAVHVGKKPEQIKALALLGERLKSMVANAGNNQTPTSGVRVSRAPDEGTAQGKGVL